MSMGNIINKVTKVQLGTVDIYNIKSAIWNENSPWVELEIPREEVIHQLLRPKIVRGSFNTLDFVTLLGAITDQELLDVKFSEDGEAFKIFMVTVDGTLKVAKFYDVRIVNLVPNEAITEEIKEVSWSVTFTASKVEYT